MFGTYTPKMELRQLRYFLAVADELHFGRAAAKLHLATPSLSQQIRALERSVKTPLFIRDTRNVELTEAGKLLLVHARPMIQSADEALAVMQEFGLNTKGQLRIGLFANNAAELTIPIMERFRDQNPDVQLSFVQLDFAGQISGLVDKRVDVAFVRPPLSDDRVTVISLGQEGRVALVPARSDFADISGEAEVDVFGNSPFIDQSAIPMPSSWIRFWLLMDELNADHTPAEPTNFALDSYDAVLADIALHGTITTVPASLGLTRTNTGVRAIPVKGLTCELAIGFRANDKNPLVQSFCDTARATADELRPILGYGRQSGTITEGEDRVLSAMSD